MVQKGERDSPGAVRPQKTRVRPPGASSGPSSEWSACETETAASSQLAFATLDFSVDQAERTAHFRLPSHSPMTRSERTLSQQHKPTHSESVNLAVERYAGEAVQKGFASNMKERYSTVWYFALERVARPMKRHYITMTASTVSRIHTSSICPSFAIEDSRNRIRISNKKCSCK